MNESDYKLLSGDDVADLMAPDGASAASGKSFDFASQSHRSANDRRRQSVTVILTNQTVTRVAIN